MLNVFLPLWLDPVPAPSPSKGPHGNMKTVLYVNKSKKLPSLDFCADNDAKKRDTAVQSASSGKIGKKE